MLAFAYYLLKVIVCTAVLFGYYYFVLRNRRFHQYNRFYLLFVLVISWLVPLARIEYWQETTEVEPAAIKLLTVVATGDALVEESVKPAVSNWSTDSIAMLAFGLVSFAFLVWLIAGLIRIARLISANPKQSWNSIHFVFTTVKGAPFSFFKYIFWNNNIDLETSAGKHILQHELTHVTEKHSADKLFVNILLVFGWINPFLWLIRKELNMIHEFIADRKAINDGDASAFASMLLRASYPEHNFPLANSFFHSPVKRRLIMLTTFKNPTYSYLRRLMILPLTCLVVVFFAFKTKDKNLHNTEALLAKSYVVVIDAGHGGVDNGSTSDAGIKEKELTLTLAKAVKDYNTNDKLQIILSREADETLTPQQRIALLQQYKADLFLSVHINDVAPDTKLKSSFGGAEINVPGQSSPFLQQSNLFGSMLSENLKGFYNGKVLIKQRKQKVWVLDQNSVCPSLLVEFGYVNNEKDIALLRTEDSRKQLAEAVLKTINQYFSYNEKEVKGTAGSKTEIKNISPTNIPANEKNPLYDMVTARVTFSGSQPGVLLGDSVLVTANSILIENNKNDTSTGRRKVVSLKGNDTEKALVVLDGKEMNWKEFSGKNIDPNQIKTISVFKGESAKNKYGERGVNGVIEVLTDPKSIVTDEPVFDKVFTRVENPPFYSNGMVAFAHFIERNIQYPKEAIANNAEGAVLIQFIVDENGKLSHFKKLSDKGFGLEEEAIRLLKISGDWSPGIQNQRKVPVQISQQIIFNLPGKKIGGVDNSTTGIQDGGKKNLQRPLDNSDVVVHYRKQTILTDQD